MNKKKLALFTPLPPIKSGISDYSFSLMGELINYFDIDVFIDDGYIPSVKINGVEIFNHGCFVERLDSYNYILYQIGNSVYHKYMIRYCLTFKGTVVLHDINLHGLLRQWSIVPNSSDFREYSKNLLLDYPPEIVEEIVYQTFIHNREIIPKYVTNGFISSYAEKIIVHSNYAYEILRRKLPYIPVFIIPHFADLFSNNPSSSYTNARINLRISTDDFVVGIFGIASSYKRIYPVLHAVSSLRGRIPSIKIRIAGNTIDKTVYETINYLKIDKIATVEEGTDLERFIENMDACDVCVNLRYPYNGENSGTLIMSLERAKPTIVTDIGSFSEFPDDCCIKLKSPENILIGEEVSMISNSIWELYNDSKKRALIAINGYEYVKRNMDLKLIAEKYYEAITE